MLDLDHSKYSQWRHFTCPSQGGTVNRGKISPVAVWSAPPPQLQTLTWALTVHQKAHFELKYRTSIIEPWVGELLILLVTDIKSEISNVFLFSRRGDLCLLTLSGKLLQVFQCDLFVPGAVCQTVIDHSVLRRNKHSVAADTQRGLGKGRSTSFTLACFAWHSESPFHQFKVDVDTWKNQSTIHCVSSWNHSYISYL